MLSFSAVAGMTDAILGTKSTDHALRAIELQWMQLQMRPRILTSGAALPTCDYCGSGVVGMRCDSCGAPRRSR